MQDVDAYLMRRGVRMPCYFDPSAAAVLDDRHQVRLNYETFFFSEEAMVSDFLADPTRFCGLLTDPVTKERFRPRSSSARLHHEGVLYLFRSHRTRELFRRRPDNYVLPGNWM